MPSYHSFLKFKKFFAFYFNLIKKRGSFFLDKADGFEHIPNLYE